MPENYQRLLERALLLISKKRYTEKGMEKKLQQFSKKFIDREVADKEIGKVLLRLKELAYLDDKQFAKDYIAERLKFRPRGKILLRRELKLKGLRHEDFEEFLKIDEEELAREALNKKIKRWEELSEKEQREKAFRFLAPRGFQLDAIYKAIESCYNHIRK